MTSSKLACAQWYRQHCRLSGCLKYEQFVQSSFLRRLTYLVRIASHVTILMYNLLKVFAINKVEVVDELNISVKNRLHLIHHGIDVSTTICLYNDIFAVLLGRLY